MFSIVQYNILYEHSIYRPTKLKPQYDPKKRLQNVFLE